MTLYKCKTCKRHISNMRYLYLLGITCSLCLKEAQNQSAWEEKAIRNIMQTKLEIKAAKTIQRYWRRYSSNINTDVGLQRVIKLFYECQDQNTW